MEGPVVYANYGTEDDFNYLEQMGISVAGKIVLVKMGDVYRGTKVSFPLDIFRFFFFFSFFNQFTP